MEHETVPAFHRCTVRRFAYGRGTEKEIEFPHVFLFEFLERQRDNFELGTINRNGERSVIRNLDVSPFRIRRPEIRSAQYVGRPFGIRFFISGQNGAFRLRDVYVIQNERVDCTVVLFGESRVQHLEILDIRHDELFGRRGVGLLEIRIGNPGIEIRDRSGKAGEKEGIRVRTSDGGGVSESSARVARRRTAGRSSATAARRTSGTSAGRSS